MLRPITASDRAAYLAMAHDFYHSPAVDHPVPDDFLIRTLETVLDGSPYARIFLWEQDGEIAGYVQLSLTWSQEAGGLTVWIEELYVKPPFRGQGLGHSFFAQLPQLVPNAARWRLEVEPDNTRAKALYQSLDFEPIAYESLIREFLI